MNVLITGVNGFIGKNLASNLLGKTNCNVIGIGRTPSEFNELRYKHIQADITKTSYLKEVKNPIDVVIHLAQSKEYRNFPDKADDLFKVNIESTFILLEWARVNKVSKFIYTSTGNVYSARDRSCKETDETEPSSFYGRTKLVGEHLVKSYSPFYKTYILRLSTIYGFGQKNMLIPNIIQSVSEGKPITLASGKGIYINPVYVDDLISILKKLILEDTLSVPDIMNVGGNEILSLDEIVKKIEIKTNKKANTIQTEGKAVYMVEDNFLLKSAFSFTEFISFSTGLDHLII